jgi:hypothetical protein
MTTQQPLDRFESQLLAELRHIVEEAGRSSAPQRPRWRRPAISAGVAAAATATVFLATSGIGPGGTSTASAADVLLGAARHAESAPQGDGIYWYVRSIDTFDEGKARGTVDLQMWQSKSGAAWAAEDADPAREIHGSRFALCDEDVDYATLRALPTEAGALRAALEDAMLHGDDGAVPADALDRFVTDCTISLLTMPVSNAVRGAAYRSLAALPGTENLGPTTDTQGRTGTELAFRDGSESQHIVVDADSGDLLQFDFAGSKGERQRIVLETGWTDTILR